ncbi:MAG: nucleotide exchange factor GrpE [Bdellovibrionales bacterium]|nr:nucleotide exchange factor GrpE [Bdellovibrionales bacterium]
MNEYIKNTENNTEGSTENNKDESSENSAEENAVTGQEEGEEGLTLDFSEENKKDDTKDDKKTDTSPKLSPLELAKKESDEFKTQYAYLKAEFENYKKNMAKEQLRLISFGSENIMLDILKISDLFEMALQTKITKDNYENIYTGFKMTSEELSKSLESHGLKKIETNKKVFDPHLHEAISSENSETVKVGYIIKECKVGYKLHDKVIRPSQVIVSAAKSKDTELTNDDKSTNNDKPAND